MKKLKLFVYFIVLSVFLVSCGKTNAQKQMVMADMAAPRMMAKNVTFAANAKNSSLDMIAEESAGMADGMVASEVEGLRESEKSENQERKLIKNGSVELEVESILNMDDAIEKWAKSFGGYVSSSSSQEKNAYYNVRVLSEKFDDAMQSAGNLGLLKSHSVSVQDVSEQFYDLQTRLSNKKIMRKNLEKYLSQAKDIKDMLQIEKELNAVISDIESMEGRMKRLSNQIDYSTINITLQLPFGKTETGFHFPDVGDGARHFFSNIISFFALCVSILFYVVVCGIPILAIIGFLYWILWGKIGLLKKLYKWLS